MWNSWSFALLVALSSAAGATSAAAQSAKPTTGADSIVLERTLCYGTCPAYRLSITRNGYVSFESRNPDDAGRAAKDNVPGQPLALLVAGADALGFSALPDTIAASSALCPDWATDHPTVIVTLFRGFLRKRVVDYHGCFLRSDHTPVSVVGRLREFEVRIDSVARSARWVRPANGRRHEQPG